MLEKIEVRNHTLAFTEGVGAISKIFNSFHIGSNPDSRIGSRGYSYLANCNPSLLISVLKNNQRFLSGVFLNYCIADKNNIWQSIDSKYVNINICQIIYELI